MRILDRKIKYSYFAIILPGNATLKVYFLPSDASKIAVGFDVSISSKGLLEPLLRFTYKF